MRLFLRDRDLSKYKKILCLVGLVYHTLGFYLSRLNENDTRNLATTGPAQSHNAWLFAQMTQQNLSLSLSFFLSGAESHESRGQAKWMDAVVRNSESCSRFLNWPWVPWTTSILVLSWWHGQIWCLLLCDLNSRCIFPCSLPLSALLSLVTSLTRLVLLEGEEGPRKEGHPFCRPWSPASSICACLCTG